MSVERIVADLEALKLDLERQCLAVRRGLQEHQRTGPIFAEHPLTTSPDSIAFLRGITRGGRDRDERERASRLYYECIGQFIRMELLMMDETVEQFLVQVKVEVDGEPLSFADMLPWVLSQGDFDKRELLKRRALPLLQKAGEFKARIWDHVLEILREDLGYPDYLSFCAEKKGIDMEALAQRCLHLLEVTDGLYNRHVEAWVEREMKRPFVDMSRYHAMRLLHLTRFDEIFPKYGLLRALRETLETMGLARSLDRRIFIDLEERPGKSPVSRCVPLRIPEEIHVTMRPMGGLSDYETLLHEVGHALHYAFTETTLPYPYRHLPRSFALSECFAFLFEGLTREPGWLASHTEARPAQIEALVHYKGLKLLCSVRRYVGKFLFERELFSRGGPWDGRIYSRWLGRATGFVYEPEAALMDLEDEFYSVDYLRAWMGESFLSAYLKENFGEEWFLSRKAGAFLVGLWHEGERLGLEELLESLGYVPEDPSYLLKRFHGLTMSEPLVS
ncbi:MAG: hypothetical protein ACUVXD_00815 [Thermodesulfobacteriota bacterium]